MTEITNPSPEDPKGASAMNEESTMATGSQQLLDAASTGTDEGPAGIPAALVGKDKRGDEVPKIESPTSNEQTHVTSQADPLSPEDLGSPQEDSLGRGTAAASNDPPEAHDGR